MVARRAFLAALSALGLAACGRRPTVTLPKIDTLCDPFTTGPVDTTLWLDEWFTDPHPPFVAAGAVQLNGWDLIAAQSSPGYTFQDSHLTVKYGAGWAWITHLNLLMEVLHTSSIAGAGELSYASANVDAPSASPRTIQFHIETGNGGSLTSYDATATFDPTAMGWWRMDARGGRLAWQTSADGVTWTDRLSLVGVASATVGLYPGWNAAGTYNGGNDWLIDQVGTCGGPPPAAAMPAFAQVIG